MRLFVAISLSTTIRQTLVQTVAELRKQAERGNFIRPKNLHLTLAFVGETEHIKMARAALHRVEAERFGLTLGKCGRFGTIWWAGVQENPALMNVAEQVQKQLRSAGFTLEDRPFVPHITLARRVKVEGPVSLSVPPVSMNVNSISLMHSHRVENRLTYTEIDRITLPHKRIRGLGLGQNFHNLA